MIVEYLEKMYAEQALEVAKRPHRWNRGSSVGYCPRRLGYQKLGIIGDPLTPRRMSILDDGNFYDAQLKADIQKALSGYIIPIDKFPACYIEGVEITRTPDFLIMPTGEWTTIGLGEIKSMSNFGFERALKGEIDESYCAQAYSYTVGNDLNPIVFVCVRKETRHICEVIFDRNAKETIITQRYGGNPLETAINDPMLVAEIRSPFDANTEMRVRETIRTVSGCTSTENLPLGINAIESETVAANGKEKAAPLESQYGSPVKVNGNWRYFETGRKVANFPCSYCAYIRTCLGAALEIKDGKPVWVVP